jgi:hypothetical protein
MAAEIFLRESPSLSGGYMCDCPVYMRKSTCKQYTDRLVTCGSSHHLIWYEPPQMNTMSPRDGKEMSTTVNRFFCEDAEVTWLYEFPLCSPVWLVPVGPPN